MQFMEAYYLWRQIMTYIQKEQFLQQVRANIQSNPELLNDVINACTFGVLEANAKVSKQAMDMEVAMVAMHSTIDERYKKSTQVWIDKLVRSKIEPYVDTCYTATIKSCAPVCKN